jgi:hypothetical protein
MLPIPPVTASRRPIILTPPAEQPVYGYQIVRHVQTPGRLYPLLHSLEDKGVAEGFDAMLVLLWSLELQLQPGR